MDLKTNRRDPTSLVFVSVNICITYYKRDAFEDEINRIR